MEVLKVAEASDRGGALIGGLFGWQPRRQGCHGGRPPSATRGFQLACDGRQLGWPGDHSVSCSPAQPESSPCAGAIRSAAHGSLSVPGEGRAASRSQANHCRKGRHPHPWILSGKRFLGLGSRRAPGFPILHRWKRSGLSPRILVARGPRRSVRPSWEWTGKAIGKHWQASVERQQRLDRPIRVRSESDLMYEVP
jgi:hypothetical protein